MIIGIGNDIVEVSRIRDNLKKHGDQFVQRLFTAAEQSYAQSHAHTVHVYAKRFAAKEALAKALGVGLKGLGAGAKTGVRLTDIEVIKNADGRPSMIVHGEAQKVLQAVCPQHYQPHIHLSLSDEKDFALAFVVIEALLVDNEGGK